MAKSIGEEQGVHIHVALLRGGHKDKKGKDNSSDSVFTEKGL